MRPFGHSRPPAIRCRQFISAIPIRLVLSAILLRGLADECAGSAIIVSSFAHSAITLGHSLFVGK